MGKRILGRNLWKRGSPWFVWAGLRGSVQLKEESEGAGEKGFLARLGCVKDANNKSHHLLPVCYLFHSITESHKQLAPFYIPEDGEITLPHSPFQSCCHTTLGVGASQDLSAFFSWLFPLSSFSNPSGSASQSSCFQGKTDSSELKK